MIITSFNEFKIQNHNLIPGGLSDHKTVKDIAKKYDVSVDTVLSKIKKGIKVELEHTNDRKIATEIAMDHLMEMLDYYDKLETIEETLIVSINEFRRINELCEGDMEDMLSIVRKHVENNFEQLHYGFDYIEIKLLEKEYEKLEKVSQDIIDELLKKFDKCITEVYSEETGWFKIYLNHVEESKMIHTDEKPIQDQIKNSKKLPNEYKEVALKFLKTYSTYKPGRVTGLNLHPDLIKIIKDNQYPSGFDMGIDKDGYYIHTHRARSKSHEQPNQITAKEIKFIDSTG